MERPAYQRYLLGMLLVILTFNLMDRWALGLAMQSIKIDLHLSDTELGFLSGIAFALFYAVMGIPIARWADRGDRVKIIALTTALWSVMVALCGAVTSFGQLLLVRIGVAVGEAGCLPPSYSLIADHFDRAERPRATAVFALGAPLSMLVGYFLAGWLNQIFGWRLMFVAIGLPGLALALIAAKSLKEPRRGTFAVAETRRSNFRKTLVTLWASGTFRSLLLGLSLIYFFGYGCMQWQPVFFIRSFGYKTGELGIWFSLVFGIAGGAGTYLGGMLASRHAAHNESLQLKAMAITCTLGGVAWGCVYVTSNAYIAFALLGLAVAGVNFVYAPLFATIQTIIRPDMRAVAIALMLLVANLVGMGFGPLAVGALSDGFRSWAGPQSLRYALLVFCPGFAWAAWYLWKASRTVVDDLAMLSADVRQLAADAKHLPQI